jgi:uncharacterized membrane protein
MDLAIINQVFYNSSLGDFFASSIHPPSYLGDHFSPILFLLLPLYYLYRNPQTLLILQTITLAFCALPIFFIAKNSLNKNWAILLSLAWLLNPFIHNINLFEFSFLPFAIFFIFWAFYFYQKEKFFAFLLFCFFALLVREDVALVVFMFGPIALLQKRKLKWWIAPMLLSTFYFFLALGITKVAATNQDYKFFIYYSWLGATFSEIIKNIFLNPATWIYHILKFNNVILFLGLIMPVVFLPIFSPFYLLLGAGIFLQLILRTEGGSETLLQTHYACLLFPAVFISAIYGLKEIIENKDNDKLINLIKKHKQISFIILMVGIMYSFLALSPVFGSITKIKQEGLFSKEAKTSWELIKKIPSQKPVASGYEFLAPLSSRKSLYSFNYVFLGKQQFLTKDYNLPQDTEYIIFDYSNLLTYQLQYGNSAFYQEQYEKGKNLWPNALEGFGLIEIKDSLALYEKSRENKVKLVEKFDNQPEVANIINTKINSQIKLIGYNNTENGYELFWQIENINDNYQVKFIFENEEKLYPFTYGLTNLSGIVKTSYWPIFYKKNPSSDGLKIQLIRVEGGGLEINEIRGTKNVIDSFKIIGPEIKLKNN